MKKFCFLFFVFGFAAGFLYFEKIVTSSFFWEPDERGQFYQFLERLKKDNSERTGIAILTKDHIYSLASKKGWIVTAELEREL